MKKLLVVLAVLFATVGAYAGEAPDDATGTVNVTVTCPINVVGGDEVAFEDVILGQVYDADALNDIKTEGTDDLNVDFTVYGCGAEATTAPTTALTDLSVILTYEISDDNTAVTMSGGWYYLAENDVETAIPTSAIPFDGSLSAYYKITEIDASAQTTIPASMPSWTLTLTAAPQW